MILLYYVPHYRLGIAHTGATEVVGSGRPRGRVAIIHGLINPSGIAKERHTEKLLFLARAIITVCFQAHCL